MWFGGFEQGKVVKRKFIRVNALLNVFACKSTSLEHGLHNKKSGDWLNNPKFIRPLLCNSNLKPRAFMNVKSLHFLSFSRCSNWLSAIFKTMCFSQRGEASACSIYISHFFSLTEKGVRLKTKWVSTQNRMQKHRTLTSPPSQRLAKCLSRTTAKLASHFVAFGKQPCGLIMPSTHAWDINTDTRLQVQPCFYPGTH